MLRGIRTDSLSSYTPPLTEVISNIIWIPATSGRQAATNAFGAHMHTLSELDSHTPQRRTAFVVLVVFLPFSSCSECSSSPLTLRVRNTCGLPDSFQGGLCNYRREKAPQQKRCGIILSPSPHPLLDLLLLYTSTFTLMPKMHLCCTRTACLLVSVVNKTSRSDWERLQKHETQIYLFCLQKMDTVLRSGFSCSFHIYEAPPLSFAVHGAARIARRKAGGCLSC